MCWEINIGQLLGGDLGVLDIFGSHIDDSSVTGSTWRLYRSE